MALLGCMYYSFTQLTRTFEERAKKKRQKIVSLGIEPRTFPEHLRIAFVNGKS